MAGESSGRMRNLRTANLAPPRRLHSLLAVAVFAAHVAILTPLGLGLVRTSAASEPTVVDVVLLRATPRRVVATGEPAPSAASAFKAVAREPTSSGEEVVPTDRSGLPSVASEASSTHGATGAAIGRAMRLNGDCRRLVDAAERAICLDRLGDRLARPDRELRPIEDAAFAAEGQRALADYDRRRAPLKPNSRAVPCPNADVMGRCDFRVETRIWSSRDGLLPDVPRRD